LLSSGAEFSGREREREGVLNGRGALPLRLAAKPDDGFVSAGASLLLGALEESDVIGEAVVGGAGGGEEGLL